MSKAKLDMGHGFMKSIIQNQVDRDTYDKHVKANKENGTHVFHPPSQKERPKKPDQLTYVPPTTRKSPTEWNAPRHILFLLEFEDQQGEVHHMPIHKEDDLVVISKRFGHDRGLPTPMIRALTDLLREEKGHIMANS